MIDDLMGDHDPSLLEGTRRLRPARDLAGTVQNRSGLFGVVVAAAAQQRGGRLLGVIATQL